MDTITTWTFTRAELAHICKWACSDEKRPNLNVVAFYTDGGILATDGGSLIYVGEKYALDNDSPPWTVPLAGCVAATKIAQSAKSEIVITIAHGTAHFASGAAEMTVALGDEVFPPLAEIFVPRALSLDDPWIAPQYLARVAELGKILGIAAWRQHAGADLGPIHFTHFPIHKRARFPLWSAAIMPCRPPSK